MTALDVDSLCWTHDISLRQFIDQYKRSSLPQLFRTTSGYTDADSVNDIGADEVLWVFGIEKQKRVIAKTENRRYVSIPLNFRQPFQKLSATTAAPGPPTSLEKLIAENPFNGLQVQLASSATVFDFSEDGTGGEQLGRVKIRDTYQEKYILARTIVNGEISDTPIDIPVYLPITIRVAIGLRHGNWLQFNEMLQSMSMATSGLTRILTTKKLSEEILMFDSRPIGDYEYVVPTKHAHMKVASNNLPYSANSKSRGATLIDHDSDSDYEETPRSKPTNSMPPSRPPPPPPLPPRPQLLSSAMPPPCSKTIIESRHYVNMSSPKSDGQQQRQHGEVVPSVVPLGSVYLRDTLRTKLERGSSPNKPSATASHRPNVSETVVGATSNTSGSNGVRFYHAYDECSSSPKQLVHDGLPSCPAGTDTWLAPAPSDRKRRQAIEYSTSVAVTRPLHRNDDPLVHSPTPGTPSKTALTLDRSTPIDGKDVYLRQFDGWNPSTLNWSTNEDTCDSIGKTNQRCGPNDANCPPSPGVPVQVVSPLRTPMTPSSILALYSDHSSVGELSSPGYTSSAGHISKATVASSSAAMKSYGATTWQTVAEVPLDVEDFTVEQVCRSLELLRMPKLASTFEEQHIDGRLIMSIVTEESLVDDFHCSMFEARKVIEFFKNKWRPKC